MAYKIKGKKKKGKYHYIVLDSGKRKRFKKGTYPSYEDYEGEEEYF